MKTATAITALYIIAIPVCVLGDTFGSGANTFGIEFVTIGNPNNHPDTTGNPNPAGSVPYGYRIGKFEISEQMIDKANADGGLGITNDSRGPDRPATSVSWNEAARFVNWLNTSTGNVPAYKVPIQPGEVGYNPNSNIQLWSVGDAGYDSSNHFRNSLARYFLPSAHEWYKAAYYEPNSGVYYDYPTGSDSIPDGIDFTGDPNFDAVFYDGGSNPQPNEITNVGVLSPYGTAGQGGNVLEWEETDIDLTNDFPSSSRGIRGGRWGGDSDNLLSSVRSVGTPSFTNTIIGFRVASMLEPEVPTDFNSDGTVDAADYVVWRKTGINGPTGYDTWRTNFGEPGSSGSVASANATVPEPTTLALLMLVMASCCIRRGRAA